MSDGINSPERQMWCAVIERALHDASGAAGGVGSPGERARVCEEARRWFVGDSIDFRRTCEAAGLDPDFVRVRALAIINADPALRAAG